MAQGREILLTNIMTAKVTNRAITTGDDITGQVVKLQKIITFVANCATATLFRKISSEATFPKEVWNVIREWAGIRPPSLLHLTYNRLKCSSDPVGAPSYEDFIYTLNVAKVQCLVTIASSMKSRGEALDQDEERGVYFESYVLVDWQTAIHNQALGEVVFKDFAEDLKIFSLADLQEHP